MVAEYIEKENKYICHACNNYYFLYEETNQCIQYDSNFNCHYENIGDKTNPIYSCKKCVPNIYFSVYDIYYNYYYHYQYNNPSEYTDSSNYLLVKEGNIKFCVIPDSSPDKCVSANVDTTYINNKYNCTSCLINHLPLYSEFYERYICQNLLGEIKKNQTININQYQNYYKIDAINEDCPNSTLFTPDGKYCYKCKDVMYGCKSECSFSLENNNILKCLDGYIDGYIESSEGICQSCSIVNDYCIKCHYGEYPTNYLGIKRKNKFICDECTFDYSVLKDDKCTSCSNIENGCYRCSIENNEFKCKQCYGNYYLNNEGHCIYCTSGFIKDKKCFKCNDINNGGIEGCNSCKFNGNKISCSSCQYGYSFLINNNSCLKTSEDSEYNKYNKCFQIKIENDNIHCLECKDNSYSVLKGINESKCIYLPELNGYFEESYSNGNDLNYYKNSNFDEFYKYYFIKYFDNYISHCTEVINIGTEDNPLYSCKKCNNYLFTDENSNINYCISSKNNIINYNDVQNCKEIKLKFVDKKIKFTCITCLQDDHILIYHEKDRVNYCMSNDTIMPDCLAKKCKQCKSDDRYFCEVCELENYEVNDITGACIEKMKGSPAITWKDIFRLEMNSHKEINGKTITGPKFNLRGETNSEINSGHAFIIYLIFKLKQPLNIRNLEDEKDSIKIKAICEIENEVKENKEDTNTVEYECIGDSENIDLNNYTLNNIDTSDDSNNLNELTSHKNLSEIENGPTYEFTMNNIQNQTSKDYNFNFSIAGKIDDNNLKNIKINGKLKMNEIDESSDCIFIIEENKKSNLNCLLNIEEYKNIKSFSFKTNKIEYNNEYNISLNNLNEVYLLNEAEKDDMEGFIIGTIITGVVLGILLTLVIIYIFKKGQKNIKFKKKEKKR